MYIEGALNLNNVTTDAVTKALKIGSILISREIHSSVGSDAAVRYAQRETPQGEVISTL